MRQVRFGVAGLRDPKDLEGSVQAAVAAGFSALEVQFVKEFTLKEAEARRLGPIATAARLSLSVHAPYFAQLTTGDPDRLKLHLGALHHACHLAALMGAGVVVCHPGKASADPRQLHDRIDRALENLGPRIEEFEVRLGLETPGRKSQFGSLGDLALIVARHPFTTPVIDFAHIHALSGGSLVSQEAFEALFRYITEHFSPAHLWPLHCHFTDNRFGDAGELTHVPYGEGTLRVGHLARAARGFDLALRIISEARWEDSHRAMLDELAEAGIPLVTMESKRSEPESFAPLWFPDRVPLEGRGEADSFIEGGRELRVTNLDKVLFPEDGYTKGDLITYCYNAAPLMLPFLADRPLVMQRVPDGIYGEAFYEKQVPSGAPAWVRTVPVPSRSGRPAIDFVVADSTATLVWLAQIASVECHAWTSRWPRLDEPDFAVLDLDPFEPIPFSEVRAVARLVRTVLDRLGLKGYPKTSGGAGLQVFIPLRPGHTYPEVREFCSALGRLISAAYPERATVETSMPRRAGKVFIDANQNARGKTLIAPYSVRPYPGAPVSMPLRWEELDGDFFPEQFTIATALERIGQVGDLFLPARLLRQDLNPALERLR
ncbi:MAG: non-homologous end-joining DNA ligase [Actinomycetota bacterium]